mmetsp:Transcript_12344/g.29557  ORF Transcript_12344/g.29557 Transcript_12344/m.29557 type:complete len:199 (+) Transcript_12344:45-641(+)|eukprot:CAMPEP_0177697206 /NCGR_PEP_ID=MMETSP0484_2-20121128/4390_1 /TAXON_ID=354590 /ORGANISM="Rhodomonas lens, Strain RHODO" /LENGTH=198 /DNA_ID=CAMNT_0019208229 /DNA_START=25 /DNA_END=621 /DNA_ORIENTATION=+
MALAALLVYFVATCSLYPAVLYSCMKIGSGEWNFEYDTTACWGISVLIGLNAYALFFLQNTRVFSDEGYFISWLWCPNPVSLVFFAYFSPIHVPVVFLRRFCSPVCHAFMVDLVLCTVHALVMLLLIDRFHSREKIQRALFDGAFNTEVSYRDQMEDLREKAKAEVISVLEKRHKRQSPEHANGGQHDWTRGNPESSR